MQCIYDGVQLVERDADGGEPGAAGCGDEGVGEDGISARMAAR